MAAFNIISSLFSTSWRERTVTFNNSLSVAHCRAGRYQSLPPTTIMSLLVLSASDVERVASNITPHELCVLMAKVFSCLSSPAQTPPTTYTPLRTLIPTANHTALFMPARISDKYLLGTTVKVVCVPRNAGDTNGLPASTIVLDETTGAAKAIVNARGLTALRNAAGMHKSDISLLVPSFLTPKKALFSQHTSSSSLTPNPSWSLARAGR